MKLSDMTSALAQGSGLSQRPQQAQGGSNAGADLAWSREMERAQSETWFLGALQSASSTAGASLRQVPATFHSRPLAMPSDAKGYESSAKAGESAVQRERSADTAVPVRATPASDAGPKGSRSAVFAHTGAGIQHAWLVSAETLAHPWPQPAESASAVKLPATQVASPRALLNGHADTSTEIAAGADADLVAPAQGHRLPVRVHVEGDELQATVWLGVDSAALAQLPGLAMAVRRWLMREGYGTPTWICNGQPLSAEQLAGMAEPAVDDIDAAWPTRANTFVKNQTPGETV